MKKCHSVYVGFLLMALFSCSQNKVTDSSSGEGLAFYFLQDSTATAAQVLDLDLKNLQLAADPFLTVKDLDFYDWESHTFEVNTDKAIAIREICEHQTPVSGIPFVVTVDNERIYLGSFWFLHSSLSPMMPHIIAQIYSEDLQKEFQLIAGWDKSLADPRADPRILKSLKEHKLLLH